MVESEVLARLQTSSAAAAVEVQAESESGAAPVVSFKKKRRRATRKRTASEAEALAGDGEEEGKSAAAIAAEGRAAVMNRGHAGRTFKRARTAADVAVTYQASGTAAGGADSLATSEAAVEVGGGPGDAGAKVGGKFGPTKASANVRVTCRFDYQPDICKDYKETGSCGYGDACKFIHDRGDYKSGWQLDKEWDEKQAKGGQAAEEESGFEVTEDDELPWACWICREDFREPVVTKCGHYFCMGCAQKQFKTSRKCAVCGENTNGTFNVARNLVAKIKERDEEFRALQEKEADEEAAEEAE